MSTPHPITPLTVAIQNIASVHAACVEYLPPGEAMDMHNEIHMCFERLQEWARGSGLDPSTLLHVGVPVLRDGRLVKYECYLQVPPQFKDGSAGMPVTDLPGGRYAVLSMQKEPALIGESIGRLYQEYLPQNGLQIDGSRPTYEVYYETTMEYCVPIR